MSQDPANAPQIDTQPEEPGGGGAIEVFISYSRKDMEARTILLAHLAMLRREGLIKTWHDGMIAPGDEWSSAIYEQLKTAHIVLLLVSKNFLDSDFCYGTELKNALDRQARGETRVVPIILGPCDLNGAPFMKFQAMPRDARPVSRWADPDEAWADVAISLRTLVEVTQDDVDRKSAGRRSRRRGADGGEHPSTLLSRYASLAGWLADMHDFFGAVLAAGGLRRMVRTFTTLTFHFDSFVAYVLSSADIEENRGRYLGPPVCLTCYIAITLTGTVLMQRFFIGGRPDSIAVGGIAGLVGLAGFGVAYFSLILRALSRPRRTFGECVAILCYVAGGLGIPAWTFQLVLGILILLARIVIGFTQLPVYTATLAVASIAFLTAIPIILMRGIRRFLGRSSWLRRLGFMASIVAFLLLVMLILQPGNIALIGSLACQGAGRPACAEELSRLSIRLQPRNEALWQGRIGALRLGNQIEDARRTAEQAIALHPGSSTLHFALAQILHHDDPTRAQNEYRRALELNPGYEDAVNELGGLYLAQREYPELLALCEQALTSTRFSARLAHDSHVRAAIALVNLKRFREAIEHLGQALSDTTARDDTAERARMVNLRGRGYAGLGERQKALGDCEEALALARRAKQRDTEAVALDNCGVNLAALDRPVEAIARYREAAAVNLSRRPRDEEEALDSLDRAFNLALRHKLWPQAEAVVAELEALDPPQFQRVRWRARLGGGRGDADAAALYATLARIAPSLPGKTQARMLAMAAAGSERARNQGRWPQCPGVVITEVVKDSPAAGLGLSVGEVIVYYQDQCLYESQDLVAQTGQTRPEQRVTLRYWSQGRLRTVNAPGGLLGLGITAY